MLFDATRPALSLNYGAGAGVRGIPAPADVTIRAVRFHQGATGYQAKRERCEESDTSDDRGCTSCVPGRVEQGPAL